MDTAQPKRGLKAFLKHATIRISSTKHHGFANDSASAYSIDDDGKSQRSSNSAKKDSKLRRIGRGIREWRSKRRRLHGDKRPKIPHTLEGKSFSSSEASLSEVSLENEDFTDEDEPVDRPENGALEASEGVLEKALEEKLRWEITHEEVAVRQRAREHVAPRDIQKQTRTQTESRKEVILPQSSIMLPPPPVYSSLVWQDLAPQDRGVKPSCIVFRRDRKGAFDFAQSTLNNEPALWTDASHRPVRFKNCNLENHGGIAVAQKLGERWTVHSAYTSGVTDIMQLESLAILMALQRAVQEKKSGTLGEGTVYICSDNDPSLQWIEKVLALATAIRRAAQEARALEADLDDLKCLIRLTDELDRWQYFCFSEYNRPENSLAASIGRRILEQYYELRRLGAWVEFHWVPAHSGLPGNEIADRLAGLSCWWLAKVAHRRVQGPGLVMPLKVLTFDEPWTRYCPHQGQPQYDENKALQLLEETKNLHVVLSTKALQDASCNTTALGPVGARPHPDVFAPRLASQRTRRLLKPAPVYPSPEVVEITVNPSNPSLRKECPPNHDTASEIRHQVVPISIPQPPPPLPQPQVVKKVRTKKQRQKRPGAFETLQCVHCWHKGHLIHQCFEKFPEQKVSFPHRYARYDGRPRLEKVMSGAFYSLARLHPHLMQQPIHGQSSRYMVGRVGISPHLTPRQCAVWAVWPDQDATATHSVQDHRRHLREKYRWAEAQCAQLD